MIEICFELVLYVVDCALSMGTKLLPQIPKLNKLRRNKSPVPEEKLVVLRLMNPRILRALSTVTLLW